MKIRNKFAVFFLAIGLVIGSSIGLAGAVFQDVSGWKTNTGKRSIDLTEILSGGVGKDGIPAIYQPRFESVGEAEQWLKENEPVISLNVGDDARAYPLQILIWHEIVNDLVGGKPVAVTFCPLCYSAVAFDRRIKGKQHVFGVSGMLRNSDMVMFDHETESWWQQLTGEAIVGDLTGTKLDQIPAQIISFGQFKKAYEKGHVLSRNTGHRRDYGRNPYVGYDEIGKSPFLFRGKISDRLPPMERLITISLNRVDKAYPYSETRSQRVVHDRIGGASIVIFHDDGAVSALDQKEISASRQTGSVGVFSTMFEGRALNFEYRGGKFIDLETGSEWDITGRSVSGPSIGRQLIPLSHGHEFAFAWLAFKPNTLVWRKKIGN